MKPNHQFDRYVVIRKLATGGMGEVFMAKQQGMAGFEKLVVVKTLKPELAERGQFRDMFLEEARVAALARHRNVVSVLDVGVDRGTYFIVMEYIDGWTLRQILDACATRGGYLPLAHVLTIAVEMARGLDYVHGLCDASGRALGLVHRDVSPENVMITVAGYSKLVDFGIAKRRDSPIETRPGILKGKARYLSPELVCGGEATPASDQFALGCVLFEMLTGEPLFRGKTNAQVMFAAGAGDIRDAGQVRPELPEPLLAILRRVLADAPSARYPSCGHVARELSDLRRDGLHKSHTELAHTLRELLPPESVARDAAAAGVEMASEATLVGVPSPPHTTAGWPAIRDTDVQSQAFSLIGRNREIDSIAANFRAGARLCTLLGPGGIGKTRLARHHAFLQRYVRNGRETYFVDLTEARSPEDVAYLVADCLEVKLVSNTTWGDATRQIGLALAGRGPAVLILDNVEQVIDPVADAVTHWLDLAPQAVFLATSREPLAVGGEVRLDIAPLARNEAIDLLCQRIRAVRPTWQPAPGDHELAGKIVDRLECLPLAIELAAARGGMVSLARLYDRLSSSFEWLRSRRRDLAERHTSLTSAIAWSWELLAQWEQDVLGQCTVFRGGFTLGDAEAVIRLPADAEGDVIDAVQSLREKSLLYGEGAGREPRFRMYDSIRSFVLGEWSSPSSGDVEARHLAYFLSEAERLSMATYGPDGAQSVDEMALSLDNFAAALETADSGQIVRLVLALDRLLAARGPASLHDSWLAAGLRAAEATGSAADRVRLLCARGMALVTRGVSAAAGADLAEACDLAETLADRDLCARAHEARGFHYLRRRELSAAWPHLDRAQSLYRDLGDRAGQARVMGKIALYHQRCGRFDQAAESYDRAIEAHETIGNTRTAGELTGRRGLLRLETGRLAEARSDLGRSIALARQWGDLTREAVDSCNLGLLEMEAGNCDDARRHLQQAIHIDTRQGNQPGLATEYNNLGAVLLDSGDPRGAAKHFRKALTIARNIEYSHLEIMASGNMGIAAQARGDLEDARSWLQTTRALVDEHPASWAPPAVFIAHLAAVHAALGDPETAREQFTDCRRRLQSGQHTAINAVISCLEGFCDLALARRAASPEEASTHLAAARARLGADSSKSCDLRIAQAVLARALADHKSGRDA